MFFCFKIKKVFSLNFSRLRVNNEKEESGGGNEKPKDKGTVEIGLKRYIGSNSWGEDFAQFFLSKPVRGYYHRVQVHVCTVLYIHTYIHTIRREEQVYVLLEESICNHMYCTCL